MADTTNTNKQIPGPAFRSTEFWLTLGTFLVSGLVLTGVVAQDNYDFLNAIASHSVETVALVLAQSAVVYKYIHTRHELKKAALKSRTRQTRQTKTKVQVNNGKRSRKRT